MNRFLSSGIFLLQTFFVVSALLPLASCVTDGKNEPARTPLAGGGDKDAIQALECAVAFEDAKKYGKAADAYHAAELYSNDPVRKANALLRAARAHRLDGMLGKELDCLIRLLNEHINRIDFIRVVDRLYEIGDSFSEGHNDLVVSWLPFIHDADRAEDAYLIALKHAPCSPHAAHARLTLGIRYLENGHYQKSIQILKDIMKLHPGTVPARCAYIELANLYYQLSKRGDGDGHWANLAIEQLDALIRDYPSDPEIPWAKKTRAEVDSIIARRLHGMGAYYHRTGQDDVASRYLSKVIRDYGTTENSTASEQLLAKIDSTYVPPEKDVKRTPKPQIPIEHNTIPLEDSKIMIVPENSDGRFLFPVRDLRMNQVRDSRQPAPERPVPDDAV